MVECERSPIEQQQRRRRCACCDRRYIYCMSYTVGVVLDACAIFSFSLSSLNFNCIIFRYPIYIESHGRSGNKMQQWIRICLFTLAQPHARLGELGKLAVLCQLHIVILNSSSSVPVEFCVDTFCCQTWLGECASVTSCRVSDCARNNMPSQWKKKFRLRIAWIKECAGNACNKCISILHSRLCFRLAKVYDIVLCAQHRKVMWSKDVVIVTRNY